MFFSPIQPSISSFLTAPLFGAKKRANKAPDGEPKPLEKNVRKHKRLKSELNILKANARTYIEAIVKEKGGTQDKPILFAPKEISVKYGIDPSTTKKLINATIGARSMNKQESIRQRSAGDFEACRQAICLEVKSKGGTKEAPVAICIQPLSQQFGLSYAGVLTLVKSVPFARPMKWKESMEAITRGDRQGFISAIEKLVRETGGTSDNPTPISVSTYAKKFGLIHDTAKALLKTVTGVRVMSLVEAHKLKRKKSAQIKLTPIFNYTTGRISREKLAQLEWRLVINDKAFTEEDLNALLTNSSSLTKAGLRADDVRRATRMLATAKAPLSELDAAQLQEGIVPARLKRDLKGATLIQPETASPVAAAKPTPENRLQKLRGVLAGHSEYTSLQQPQGLAAGITMKPYQLEGFSWLNFMTDLGLGACLADQVGLGKSLQALALIQHKKNHAAAEGKTQKPVLMVVPGSLLKGEQWPREVKRFTPNLKVVEFKAGKPIGEDVDIVFTTYEALVSDHSAEKALYNHEWSGVILDEGQKRKNVITQNAVATSEIGHKADYRVMLSGTPMENHVGELYSAMDFLNPGLLGTPETFQRDFFNPIHVRATLAKDNLANINTLILKESARTEAARTDLMKRVSPFMLRRSKEQPGIIEQLGHQPYKVKSQTYTLPLNPQQTALYKQVVETLKQSGEEKADRGQLLQALTRLKQITLHPALGKNGVGDAKILTPKQEKLAELLDNIVKTRREKALVFTQYKGMGDILQKQLEARFPGRVHFFHGKLSSADKKHVLDAFKASPDGAVLIMTTTAGNAGHNLQEANHVIHYDQWWTPAVKEQCNARAARLGQKKDVEIHTLLTQAPVDTLISDILDDKSETLGQIIPSGRSVLSKLSTASLRLLLQKTTLSL